MCGIIGYIGKDFTVKSVDLGIEALKRLEYRGYDSSGFAFWNAEEKKIFSQKAVGKIASLEEKLDFSPVRGLSNEFTEKKAHIDIREGTLLVIREL